MKKISLASSVVGATLLGVASVGAHAAPESLRRAGAEQRLQRGCRRESQGRFLRRGQVRCRQGQAQKPPRPVMKAAAVRIARPRKVPAVARRRPAKATAAPTKKKS